MDEDISAEGMLHGIPAHRPSDKRSGGGRPRPSGSPSNLRALLESLGAGLYRLVVHPAFDSEELRAVDDFYGTEEALKRQAVLSALVAPEIREVVRARQIVLVPMRELWDYQSCRLK